MDLHFHIVVLIPSFASAFEKNFKDISCDWTCNMGFIWGANCLTSEMDPWLGRSAMLLAEGTLAIHARAFHSLSSFSSSSNKLRQALTLDVPFMKTSFAAQFSPKKNLSLAKQVAPQVVSNSNGVQLYQSYWVLKLLQPLLQERCINVTAKNSTLSVWTEKYITNSCNARPSAPTCLDGSNAPSIKNTKGF